MPQRSRSDIPPCEVCGRRVKIRDDGTRARHRTGPGGIDGPLCTNAPKEYVRL